jgi:putative transcription factor
MQCELCGNECGEAGRKATIDNVEMLLCPSCMKHGKSIAQSPGAPTHIQQSLLRRQRRIRQKDVYEKMDKEIISNLGSVIQDARVKKGLTREQLGFSIGERTVTISKIENDELRPSDKIVKKLEKALDITLFEEVKKVSTPKNIASHGSGLTLGDFIREE